MRNLLYAAAAVLVTVWTIGYLGYNNNKFIHILLVIAIIAVLYRVIRRKRVF